MLSRRRTPGNSPFCTSNDPPAGCEPAAGAEWAGASEALRKLSPFFSRRANGGSDAVPI